MDQLDYNDSVPTEVFNFITKQKADCYVLLLEL